MFNEVIRRMQRQIELLDQDIATHSNQYRTTGISDDVLEWDDVNVLGLFPQMLKIIGKVR